jgi:TRAP-type C4-dicarboxylate transport system permease small subunit
VLTIREIIELFIKVSITSVCAFAVMGVACICTYVLIQLDMFLFPDSWPVFMDATTIQTLILAVAVVHGLIFVFFSILTDLRDTIREHERRRAEQSTAVVDTT